MKFKFKQHILKPRTLWGFQCEVALDYLNISPVR